MTLVPTEYIFILCALFVSLGREVWCVDAAVAVNFSIFCSYCLGNLCRDARCIDATVTVNFLPFVVIVLVFCEEVIGA